MFALDYRVPAWNPNQTAVTVAERPGWETLTAVTNGAVVELDDDVASRWGPRVVDLFRVIVDSVNTVS